MNFIDELSALLNRHNQENVSNTPDWILAQFAAGCLTAFHAAIQQREHWYGRDPRPSEPTTTLQGRGTCEPAAERDAMAESIAAQIEAGGDSHPYGN